MDENESIDQTNQRLDQLLGLGSRRKVSSGVALPTDEPTIQTASMLIGMGLDAGLQPPEDLRRRWMEATQRIKQNPIASIRQRFAHSSGIFTFCNAAIVLAIIVLIVACVRAFMMPKWEKIDIYWVYVTRQHLFTISPVAVTPQVQESPVYTLSDVKNILGSGAKLPIWLSDGFKFDSVPTLDGVSKVAMILWIETQENRYIALSEHRGIILYVQSLLGTDTNLKNTIGTGWIGAIAPGSFKEISVNGLPALLVKGDWADPSASFWAQGAKKRGLH